MPVDELAGLLFRAFVVWQVGWGLVAFVMVWRDKGLARSGRGRTAERDLHRAEAWGGWLGSFAAQQVFRHKTRKVAYQRVFRRIAAGWALVWVGILLLRTFI